MTAARRENQGRMVPGGRQDEVAVLLAEAPEDLATRQDGYPPVPSPRWLSSISPPTADRKRDGLAVVALSVR